MKYLIGFLFLAFSVSAYSQGAESEALFNTVKENFFEYRFQENTGITTAQLQTSGLAGDSLAWAENYIIRSMVYREEFERALFRFNSSLTKDRSGYQEPDLYYDVLALEAWIFKKLKQYDNATASFTFVLEQIPDSIPSAKAAALNNFANMYWEKGDPERYLTLHKQALEFAKAANDPDRISRAYRNMAEYHEKISYQLDKAVQLREKAESFNSSAKYPETIIANDIRKAIQLRDAKNDFETAQILLTGAKQASLDLGLMSLYNSAHEALMRNAYLITQERKTERNQTIFIAALLLILFAIGGVRLYRYYYPDKNELFKRVS